MIIMVISGKAKQGKTTVATLLPLHLKNKRCKIISYYDVLDFIYPRYDNKEKEALISTVNKVSETFFTEYIKVYISIWSNKYDVLIVDDVDREEYFNYLKDSLNAIILGVEKDYPYIIPYSLREDIPKGTLGSPDFILKNPMTLNKLHDNISEFIKYIKEKGYINND